MVGLFAIYLICLFLIFWRKSNAAFCLVILNLILSFLMLLYHSKDALNIRL